MKITVDERTIQIKKKQFLHSKIGKNSSDLPLQKEFMRRERLWIFTFSSVKIPVLKENV